MTKRIYACLLVGSLAGCRDPSSGSVPRITDLGVAPSTIFTDTHTEVQASFDFTDDDGDVETVEVTLEILGEVQTLAADLANAEGVTEGSGVATLVLMPVAPALIEITLVLVDANGTRSNDLIGTVDAVASRARDQICGSRSCREPEVLFERASVSR